MTKFGFGWLAGLTLLGALASGCSKNEGASAACASAADGDACSACCTKNGASGHTYVTGSSCGCLGGEFKAAAGSSAAPAAPAGSAAPAHE